MTPWATLLARLAAAYQEGPTPNLLAGLQATVAPPAIIIRPDTPWIAQGEGFRFELERYAAVLVSAASTPDQAQAELYAMALVVLEAASDQGWDWTALDPITLDETTGTPLLVAVAHLTYKRPTT